MLLVVQVVSLVDSSVWPLEDSFAVHFVIFPMAFVLLAVDPVDASEALHHIVVEVAFVDGSIGPSELPFALLCSFVVLSTSLRKYPS